MNAWRIAYWWYGKLRTAAWYCDEETARERIKHYKREVVDELKLFLIDPDGNEIHDDETPQKGGR